MNGVRTFLDTNILVYALCPSAPEKSRRAQAVMEAALTSGRGVVSYQVAQEFISVALHKFRRVMRLQDLASMLAQVFQPMLEIEPSLPLYSGALGVYERFHLAWYDALIVAAAQAAGCAILYSEDFQHGQRFDRLRVENPFL
ncbi:MAG: PIN domain-containing protein [Terriglobales bacterium]